MFLNFTNKTDFQSVLKNYGLPVHSGLFLKRQKKLSGENQIF